MKTSLRIGFWLLLVFVADQLRDLKFVNAADAQTRSNVDWKVTETANFRVWGIMDPQQLQNVASRCEALRKQYILQWLERSVETTWSSKCDVVLYPSSESYLCAIREVSAGTCIITTEENRVIGRHIAIRADSAKYLTNALPHEITHAVLADRFDGRRIPMWADEGMSILSESEDQQQLHLNSVHSVRRVYVLGELLDCSFCPATEDRALFYGQSLSLMRFLMTRKSAGTFVLFLETALSLGYDAALREHYSIDGVADLEHQWLASIVKT